MNVGVTGASGFLGRRIVAALRDAGMTVRSFVRDPSQVKDTDVTTFELTRALDSRYEALDALVHAAAYIPRNFEEMSEARACVEANVLGTLDAIRGSHAAGVRSFIYVSAGNAYAPLDRAATESDRVYPTKAVCYLESKVCGEVLADAFARTHSIRAVHLRPSAIFGPGMRANALIPTAINKFRARERVVLHNGGTHEADFVFVDDVAAAVVTALTRDVEGPFNVGGGGKSSTLRVVQSLAEILDASPDQIEIEPCTAHAASFPALDISRATQLLDYRPRALRAGLEACARATP